MSNQHNSESSEDLLEIRNLSKVYPDGTVAVDEISFSAGRGEFCVLIGPSGCGKSTTLHSIVGKFPVTSGEIWLDGENITDSKTFQRDIGLVFQDFQLFPHLSVEENIRYGLDSVDLAENKIQSRISDVTEIMNLQEELDRSPDELSAGQKQRVALARSLVLEPQIILLDEPLGDMDYKLQKRMERELLRIHSELDTTFIYVTHDQNQAMRLADQIVVMNEGKIEQSGSVEKVYNEPRTAFVAVFVGDSNLFTGKITNVGQDGTVVEVSTRLDEYLVSTKNLKSAPESLLGESVSFIVRPHHIQIGTNGPNTVKCRVLDIIHKPGGGSQLLLESESAEQSVDLQVSMHERVTLDREEITISWDTEDTLLLEQNSVLPDADLQEDILGE